MTKNNKDSNKKNNKKSNKTTKDNFGDTSIPDSVIKVLSPTTTTPATPSTYEDVITFLSVSATAGDNPTTFSEKIQDYFILVLKYGLLVLLLTLNFLGLSVSLNCNADEEFTMRVISAIFAFFFGFVYLIVNYYTYKVLGEGKICKMNKDKLFPFKT